MVSLGYHISAAGSADDFIEHVKKANTYFKKQKLRLNALQIFVSGPLSYVFLKAFRSSSDCSKVRLFLKKMKIDLFVHGSYMDSPWKGSKKAIDHINKELKICDQLHAKGLVIHIPRAPVKQIAKYIRRLTSNIKYTKILLETNATCVGLDGVNFSKLNKIMKMIIEKKLSSQIGICIDTAHLWSKGLNIRHRKTTNSFLQSIKYPQLVKLIHLNENSNKIGSCKDIHESILAKNAKIWKRIPLSKTGLCSFVTFAKKRKIPCILERHNTKFGKKSTPSVGFKNLIKEYDFIKHI